MIHIQTAKGAFKMGLYDTSDRYMKEAQNKRVHSNQNDMRLIVPIIKLKTEQCKSELRNMSFEANINRLTKIHDVLSKNIEANKKAKEDEALMINSQANGDAMSPFERVQTFYKANMLKFQLVKKMLTITLDEA